MNYSGARAAAASSSGKPRALLDAMIEARRERAARELVRASVRRGRRGARRVPRARAVRRPGRDRARGAGRSRHAARTKTTRSTIRSRSAPARQRACRYIEPLGRCGRRCSAICCSSTPVPVHRGALSQGLRECDRAHGGAARRPAGPAPRDAAHRRAVGRRVPEPHPVRARGRTRLEATRALRVLTHSRVPSNDGGLALGQAVDRGRAARCASELARG